MKILRDLRNLVGYMFYNKQWKIVEVVFIGSDVFQVTIQNVDDENEKYWIPVRTDDCTWYMVDDYYQLDYSTYRVLNKSPGSKA